MKHSEDDNGIIIRIVNYGTAENVKLNFFGKDYNVPTGNREIKTLKYKNNTLTDVDMLER